MPKKREAVPVPVAQPPEEELLSEEEIAPEEEVLPEEEEALPEEEETPAEEAPEPEEEEIPPEEEEFVPEEEETGPEEEEVLPQIKPRVPEPAPGTQALLGTGNSFVLSSSCLVVHLQWCWQSMLCCLLSQSQTHCHGYALFTMSAFCVCRLCVT